MNDRAMPVTGFKQLIASITVSLGTFLVALDQFIANVSIPTISGDLGVSRDDGSWVITSFTIASAIVIPLVGWLTTVFGQVRYFAISCVLFAVASFLCGLATSFTELLIFRVLQGAVSGALIPLSQTILLNLYPADKKGFAIGVWGIVVMIGPAMGPVLGGWITDNYGWSWIFYINVPIGILAGLVTYYILYPFETQRKKVPVDYVGIALIICAIGGLQIVLDKGQDLDWFNSNLIRALAIISAASFAILIPWEIYHKNPVVQLDFFKSRNFTLGVICVSLSMMILFGSFILFPLWVQAQLGYTPYLAGKVLFLVGVLAIFVFPLIGTYQHIIDLRIWVGLAFLIFAATFYWYSKINAQATFMDIAFPRLFQGVGFALFFVPLTTIALAGIPPERYPNATSLYSFARLIFLSFGISLSITFWERRQSLYQTRFVEFMIPSNPGYLEYLNKLKSELGLVGKMANQFIYDKVLLIESYTMSLLDLNYLSMWISFLMFLLLLFLRAPKRY